MGCVHTHRRMLAVKDEVVQVVYEMLWKKLEKIIERLGRIVKL